MLSLSDGMPSSNKKKENELGLANKMMHLDLVQLLYN